MNRHHRRLQRKEEDLMKKTDLDRLLKKLGQEKSEKEKILKALKASFKEALLQDDCLATGDHLADKCPSVSRASLSSQIQSLEKIIKKYGGAIVKIQSGEYTGLCRNCENPIGIERLLAVPATELCVECKEDQENTRTHRTASFCY